jgi:hypothetical protein
MLDLNATARSHSIALHAGGSASLSLASTLSSLLFMGGATEAAVSLFNAAPKLSLKGGC